MWTQFIGRVRLTLCVPAAVGLFACGGDGVTDLDPDVILEDNLTFVRQNGSALEFPDGLDVYAWCGPWETDFVPDPSIHVFYGSGSTDVPWMILLAVLEDVTLGVPLAFPNDFLWDAPTGASLYVGDPVGGWNEASSQQAESAGQITFTQLECGDGGVVEFSVDAKLGSEFHMGPTITVTGTFRASLTGPPAV